MAERKFGIDLKSYDDIFKTEEEREDDKLARIREIPIADIDDFPDHPFQVRDDEDMQNLVESIRERGVITPAMVREKEDGRYELISGHRRKRACELAGMDTLRCEVVDMDRDEAIIMMVESNLQRSVILPSEKAFSYKMRLDAMKRQGIRKDLEGTSTPVAGKLRNAESADVVGAALGESGDQVRRFIRLTELIPPLLNLVDEGKIALRPAVELSYLKKDEQKMLMEAIEYTQCTPSHAQAIRLRAFSIDGALGPHVIENVMNEEKPNQKERISVRYADVRKYIPSNVPFNKTGDYIMKALDFYQRYQERKKSDRGDR